MKTNTTKTTARVDKLLEGIALNHLRISTLRAQKSDRLDFHEVGVGSLKDALLAAYNAGRNDARHNQ